MSNDYFFNHKWFDYQKPVHEKFLNTFCDKEISILEIGAYEGMSTLFFLDNYNSTVDTIDPFIEGDKTTPVDSLTFNIFNKNVSKCKRKGNLTVYKDYSCNVLPELLLQNKRYDYILIDGSHLSTDVLVDAIICYNLVKPNGYIFFDDFQHDNLEENRNNRLKATDGIRKFIELYDESITIRHLGYHLVIQKN